ncbi:MAG TPA: hypothetical protein VJJ23_06060 [Candidatus Nanoarchaeia archaeon]|nr:hypothetical protein [Candidatus Nanoarchaeia archaeon]
MPKLRTIRNIDEATWTELKSLAVRNKVPIGVIIERVVKSYRKNSEDNWPKILKYGKIISDKEAYEMHDFVKKLRKEPGFRK